MKLFKLIPAAAIALTAFTNFDTKAGENLPNGWKQVGPDCEPYDQVYIKLIKESDNSKYGVWSGGAWKWVTKDVTLEQANRSMNNKCGGDSYQPT